MTNLETPPNSSPEPKVVLGVDPPAPAPEPKPVAPTPPPLEEPTGVRLAQEEYDSLTEYADHYRTIVGDDQLRGMVFDYLRKKAAGIIPEPAEETPTVPDSADPTVSALGQRMAKMETFLQRGAEAIQKQQDIIRSQAQEIAALRTDRFGEKNPSFKQHQNDVAKVLKVYPNMTLEDALTLVEAKAQRASNGTVNGRTPALPTTEGGGAGSIPADSGGVDEARFQEALSRINDPKAKMSMDQCLDEAQKLFGL